MKPCRNGQHSLTNVYENKTLTVRWCQYCGAVVVDKDYDGRTSPSYFMKMRFPELMKRLVVQQ